MKHFSAFMCQREQMWLPLEKMEKCKRERAIYVFRYL